MSSNNYDDYSSRGLGRMTVGICFFIGCILTLFTEKQLSVDDIILLSGISIVSFIIGLWGIFTNLNLNFIKK